MFADEFEWTGSDSEDVKNLIDLYSSDPTALNSGEQMQRTFKFRIKIADEESRIPESCYICFELPPNYPSGSPKIYLSCPDLDRSIHRATETEIQNIIHQELQNEDCLLTIITTTKEYLATSLSQLSTPSSNSLYSPSSTLQSPNHPDLSSTTSGPSQPQKKLTCALLWFHHLLSLTKRKNIVTWASELDLRGVCKPGYPGILVVEGLDEDITEYISRLKALRWQAITVRDTSSLEIPVQMVSASEGSCKLDINQYRRIKSGLNEKGVHEVESMSEVGEIMKEAKLEPLFLSAMKISKT
ncbi:hypothetical protein BKA69DRAFT_1128135 [Paraphysoderma sedebokerense]|nr:hypothetical protein BKA69DRAFT_1128135 [Paraphysoderma sedebokerense]